MSQVKNKRLIDQMTQLYGDMKTNTKYKQSLTNVMDLIHVMSDQYQWLGYKNDKIGMVNLLNDKMGLKQIMRKLQIRQDYDKQRVLITKAYVTKNNPQHRQNIQPNSLLNFSDLISQQVLLVHYANRLHIIKQSHNVDLMTLQKSQIVTAPLIPISKNTRIIIQPYSSYMNPQYKPQNTTYEINKLNYQFLLNKIKQTLQSYQQLLQFKTKFYQDDPQNIQKITHLHQHIKSIASQMLNVWHDRQAGFRIALVTENDPTNKIIQPIPDIYIYQPFQIFYTYKTASTFNINLKTNTNLSDRSVSLSNLILSIRLIKQLLLYQLISTKHQPAINNFKQFQNKLQTDLYRSLKQRQRYAQKQRSMKLENIKNTQSLKNYQNTQIKSLFLNWNKKLKSKSSIRTPFISILLNSMYLVNQYKYIRMKCELYISHIDRKNKQYQSQIETKYFTFLFDENTQDWNVKLVPQDNQKNKKNILFDLSKVSDFFNIMIKITPQSQNTSINGITVISKRQKLHGFGDNQQLVLYQQDKMGNQKIVGFLKLFYLVKDYYDTNMAQTFDLQKYRNIKVLQTMSRIPANYFEQTFINYNPNQIKLFSQLIGHKSGITSRRNFEHVYLKLIEFLENQRMDQRRQSVIIMSESGGIGKGGQKIKGIEGKQRRFMPHQRMTEYENIMKIRLGRQIVNSYNGLDYTHWIDQLNKITKSQKVSQKLADSDLIGEFMYMRVSGDELSMKTSLIVNESLKQAMYQSQVLLISNAHIETMGVMSTIFALNQNSVNQYKGSIYRSSNGRQMKRVKLQKCNNKLYTSQTFNPHMVPLINRLITLYRHHQLQQQSQQKSNSLQKQTTIISSSYQQPIDHSRLVQFVVNFLNTVYPYSQPKSLQRQLMYVRYFVSKYLPQLSFQLNRKNIGLENFVTKYLLSLFTIDLEEQVTFQIWDFIIMSTNKFAARINSILTLLIFMQKNNFTPIIPLDTFVSALKQNYNRFDFSYNAKKVSQLMISSLGQFYQKQHQRKSQFSKMRNNTGKLLIGDQFVKKVLFDTDRLNKVSYQKNKVNLNELNYKLPQPKYYGHPVQQVQLLIRSFSITQTVSVQNWILLIKWHNQCFSIKINQKSQILNSYVKFEYPKYLLQNLHDMPCLEFVIHPLDDDRRYFVGSLDMMGLHKDSVYCQQVKIVYIKNGQIIQSNKGENVINVQLILKSKQNKIPNNNLSNNNSRVNNNNNYNSNIMSKSNISIRPSQNITTSNINLGLQKEYYLVSKNRQQQIYSSLLDYDISQKNNSTFSSIVQLRKQLIRMKNPIDQFSKQKYQKVKIIPIGDNTFPQVVMNSQLLIQELHALVESFGDDKMRTIIPTLYKIFSQQTNYQMVFLTEILFQAILIDNTISFQTKIEYLYLIGKHYQNCNSKGLTSQTVDYIFYYIYKTYGWLSPVTYSKQNKGKIIKAIIYTKGIKNNQDTLDFTQILQDYAHINKIKYGQFSIVLGNAQFLTQLSQLLPTQTLQMLQKSNNKEIKIQITYTKNNSQYLYTANVNLKDFRITQQGGKFMSKHSVRKDLNGGKVWVHSQYCNNKDKLFYNNKDCQSQCYQTNIQLDTSSQILFNCNNIITLQSPYTFDRITFRKAIYTTPMISYLLNYSSLYQPIRHQINRKMIIPRSFLIKNQQIQLREYKDWILYRYQYCQQQWRRCQVQKIQNDIVYVRFNQNQLKIQTSILNLLSTKYKLKISNNIYCKAPTFQVWSMEENLVNSIEQTQQTQDQLFKRNQKQVMNKIASQYQSSY